MKQKKVEKGELLKVHGVLKITESQKKSLKKFEIDFSAENKRIFKLFVCLFVFENFLKVQQKNSKRN